MELEEVVDRLTSKIVYPPDKLPDTPKIEIPLLMLELIKLESPEIETLLNPQYPESGETD